MNPNMVSELIGGGFALVCATLGALLTYFLKDRALRAQRAYEEALHRREQLVFERDKLYPITRSDAAVERQMLDRGATLLSPDSVIPLSAIPPAAVPPGHSQSSAGASTAPSKRIFFACLRRGTMVMMDDESFRPVEKVKLGDLIRAYNSDTHTEGPSAIQRITICSSKKIVTVNNMIAVTPEHKVLCDGDYRAAITLPLGGVLVAHTRCQVEVTSVELIAADEEVYSITLADGPGYFIRNPESEYALLVRDAA